MMTTTIRNVAVIGAGPSGLVACKVLSTFGFNVTCYERESMRGGLWNYYAKPIHSDVPNRDPHQDALEWTSAMYDDLETNVDKNTMAYGTAKMDPAVPLFMDRMEVLGYIRQYGKEVDDFIKYSHRVVDVCKNVKWTVKSIHCDTEIKDEYDAVVFATGNYNVPNIPDRKGLKEWDQKFPGSIIHSKEYRKAEYYRDKNVVVVGGSISAYDIVKQVSKTANSVYQSIRSRKVIELLRTKSAIILADVVKFNVDDKSIIDVDGNKIENVDMVIFATGYLRSYPALKQINNSDYPIVTDGFRLHNLYQHIFYINDPSLVFLATMNSIVPFPTAEAQIIWIALIWQGQLNLPTIEQQREWVQKRVEERGEGAKFHTQKYPENCDYHDYVTNEISKASNVPIKPRVVDNNLRIIRQNVAALKVAHEAFKQKFNRKAYSIEEMVESGCFTWPE